jgi:hypothetical protein
LNRIPHDLKEHAAMSFDRDTQQVEVAFDD